MRKIILAAFLCVLTLPALADDGKKITVGVDGMVCDFCAQSLEKLFGKEEGVKDIDVDLDSASVTIFLEDGKSLSDEKIDEIITYSGYEVSGIQREEE